MTSLSNPTAVSFCCPRSLSSIRLSVISRYYRAVDAIDMRATSTWPVLLIGMMAALLLLYPRQSSCTMSPIPDTSSEYSEQTAMLQIVPDLEGFISKFDKEVKVLKKDFKDFLKTRVKDNGIRGIAKWGVSLLLLLDTSIPLEPEREEAIYSRLLTLATMLRSGSLTTFSHVENTIMRGWPIYRNPNNKYIVYDGFNFGYITHVIAGTAKIAALRGDHDTAINLIIPVLEGLYDGFLTNDPAKTKLDSKGRQCLVPPGSPPGRFERYREIKEEQHCLDIPEMYNHGTALARMGMALHQAIGSIDWGGRVWPFPELPRKLYNRRLKRYILRTGRWFKSAMAKPSPTTGNSDDLILHPEMYPGEAGTRWHNWKYRNLEGCEKYEGTMDDRPADLSHSFSEMAFVTDFMEWALGNGKAARRTFRKTDLKKFIVTFLNGIVRDYAGPVLDRFSCDILGTVESDIDNDVIWAWKSCGGQDGSTLAQRPRKAILWTTLGYAAKRFMAKDKALRCDVYRLVRTTLPLVTEGSSDFDSDVFRAGWYSKNWSSQMILTKYLFYNYDYGLQEACGSSQWPTSPIDQ